jgi:YebC/PmpR family DNA-binding regulatory protein
MSGHSKWANIRVRKGAQDKKRGKIFTRHAKLIEMAARSGGDPTMNPGLRTAIDNAKAENVPNMNIERAIKKGTGELKGEAMAEIIYAAYGPGGVAFVIECLTDNRNRTISNIKMILNKGGATVAESNAVLWMFQRKGFVSGQRQAIGGKPVEELELELIDFGAEDVEVEDGIISVVTDAGNWPKIRDFLKNQGCEILSAGLKFLPTQKTEVKDAGVAKKIIDLAEAIEEDEDVTEVHTNAEILV